MTTRKDITVTEGRMRVEIESVRGDSWYGRCWIDGALVDEAMGHDLCFPEGQDFIEGWLRSIEREHGLSSVVSKRTVRLAAGW